MQKNRIGMMDLQKAITGMLEEEVALVNRNADKITKQVAKETCKVVKQEAGFTDRSGKYIRAIKVSSEQTGSGREVHTVSASNDNNNGQYRLTHLLEDGHKTVKSHGKYGKAGKTRAFPHFTAGAEYADWRLEQLVKELVNED